MPEVFIATDHAGYELKQQLVSYIGSLGHEVVDMGAHALDPDDDYPDFITPCAKRVAGKPGSFGIVLGMSGQGEAMAANRIPGVRAAVFYGEARVPETGASMTASDRFDIVRLSRLHNDANVLSLGAGFISEEQAKQAVLLFLTTPFSKEVRHIRRIGKF